MFVFDDNTGLGYNSIDITISADTFEGEPGSLLQLATIMSRMWVSFIVNGDPNQAGGAFQVCPPLSSPLPTTPPPVHPDSIAR